MVHDKEECDLRLYKWFPNFESQIFSKKISKGAQISYITSKRTRENFFPNHKTVPDIHFLSFFFFLKLLVSPGHSCGRHPHPHPPGFGMGSKLDLNSVLPLTVWTRLVSCLNLILPSVRWRYCAAAARTDSDHTHKHSYHTAWHVDEAQQIRIHWFSESSELK